MQQRRKLRVQIPILHEVVVQRADGAHEAAAVKQGGARHLRRNEGKAAGFADEERLRAQVFAGLQQALAGELFAAKTARVTVCWN